MLSHQGEKQALRYNAKLFSGSLKHAVMFARLAVIFAALTVFIHLYLAFALPIPISASSNLAWLNLLLRIVPPGLSTGFLCCALRFWREAGKCRQAALEIWDRQLSADRFKKDHIRREATGMDLTNSPSPLRSPALPTQSKQATGDKAIDKVEARRRKKDDAAA